MAGVVKIQRDAERNRRRELERRREKSDMMFAGMARVVERFAVCDLDRDRYQYHERRGEPLYQPEGSYQQMLEQISRKYVVLTDSENAKIPQMLAPENCAGSSKRTTTPSSWNMPPAIKAHFS